MKTFKEFLEESSVDTLDERQGNLRGVPSELISRVISRGQGQDSEMELFKSNAKQKDITQSTKYISGYVQPKDRSSSWRYSNQAEKQAQERRDIYSGVLIKVNGEFVAWAYHYSGNDYSLKLSKKYAKDNGFEDDVRIQRVGDFSNYLNFSEDTVDIYLVKVDDKRKEIRADRIENRRKAPVSGNRQRAIQDFLNKRGDGLVRGVSQDVQQSADALNREISNIISLATTGKEFDSGLVSKLTQELDSKLTSFLDIAYYLNGIQREGKIYDKNWWGGGIKKTHYYDKFLQVVKDLQKEFEE